MTNNTLPGHVSGPTRAPGSSSGQSEHSPGNLWGMLAELGNKLVQNHGFSIADLQGCSTYLNRTTEPLVRFLVWLEHTPEASAVLRDMGAWEEHGGEKPASDGAQLSSALSRPRWPHETKHSVA